MTVNTQVTAQHIQAWAQQALSLQKAGQYIEASQAYLTILQHAPNHWPSCYNLGLVFQALDRSDDALNAYQRAIAGNPNLAQAHNNLANVLTKLGRREEAETAYLKALAINPDLAEARYNAALIEQSRGKFSASVGSLRKVVSVNPQHDDAWDALYRALLGLKRTEDAIDAFVEWEAAVGQSPSLTAAGLALSRSMGDVEREKKYVDLAVLWPFAASLPQQLVPILGMIQYYDVTGEQLLACYRRYNDAIAAQRLARVPALPLRAAGSRIRVGYVSADFRRHVMGRIMMEVIAAHDRAQFEIVLVSLCEKMYQDEVTLDFKRITDAFIDVAALTDFDAAKAIAEADLDVLVDLAGLTMGARPAIYAHRPARHIVTHLGYHGCIGLDTVDYKITDPVADIAEAAAYQIERPCFLDACLFPFLHLSSTPEDEERARASKTEIGLDGHFVFATFVNVLKLSARCLAAWRQILQQAPHAVLAFSPLSKGDEAGIRRVLAAAGIDEAQLRFIPAGTNDSTQRARYLLVDAVLDTFPYAGGDTTLAALDRDVPVITLSGRRNAERVGVSILTHLGVRDTICDDVDAYVRCAVRIANDAPWRADLVARIAHARATADFSKIENHTRALEKAFTGIAAVDEIPGSPMSAREFYSRFQAALRRHQAAREEAEYTSIAGEYAEISRAQPHYLPLLQARAALAQMCGDPRDALTLLATAHEASPADANVSVALATLLIDEGRPDEAMTVIAAALPGAGAVPVMHLQHARALLKLAQPNAAIKAIGPYVQKFPNAVDGLLIHANALGEIHQVDDALNVYRRILSIDNRSLVANYNAAVLWLERGEMTIAESLLRRVIELDPQHERAFAQLAALLRTQGKTDAYTGLAKVFIAQNPTSLRARLARAESHRFEGDLGRERAELVALAQSAIASGDHDVVEEIAFAILKRGHAILIDVDLRRQLEARYEAAVSALYGNIPQDFAALKTTLPPAYRLRICVFADGAQKSVYLRALVAWLQVNLDENVDATIALIGKAGSDWLREIASSPFSVMQLGGQPPSASANAIRAEAFDVVLDCCGLRQQSVAPILVQRPARIQVVNPAFALPYRGRVVDFELFDAFSALPEWSSRGPDRPMLRVPEIVNCSVGDSGASRLRQPAPAHKLTFAIAATVDELSIEVLAWWRAILDALPAAQIRVAVKAETELRSYQRVFQGAGIGASRIVSHIATTQMGDASWLHDADAFLDMSTSSDAIAAAEALRHGCPVIAMRGAGSSERMAYATLAHAGLSESIAESGRDYIAMAVKLATDVAFATRIREEIRAVNVTPPGRGALGAALLTALRASAATVIAQSSK